MIDLELKEHKIREIKDKDLEQLAELQLKVFSRKRELSEVINYYKWKYLENPAGRIIGILAETSKGEVIGKYGAIPCKIKIGDDIIVVNYITTTAVDPSHRKKSIFKEMYFALQQKILESKNYPICIGFPNPLAFKIGKKSLGYYQVLKIYSYLIKLEEESVKNKFKISAELEITKNNKLPEDYPDFWLEVKKDYENITCRENEQLEWRIFKQPNNQYHFFEVRSDKKLIGYFVLDIAHETRVIDFLCFREQELVSKVFYSMLKIIHQFAPKSLVRFPIYDEYLEYLMAEIGAQVVDVSPFACLYYTNADHRLIKRINNSANWYLNGSEYFIA